MGERGATLSHGQRQRLAIARAAVRDAPILILDEPTTGLDSQSEQAVIQGLQFAGLGRTVLLITHDLALAARADRIVYLEEGRVIEEGTPAALLEANGRFAAMYAMQGHADRALAPLSPHTHAYAR